MSTVIGTFKNKVLLQEDFTKKWKKQDLVMAENVHPSHPQGKTFAISLVIIEGSLRCVMAKMMDFDIVASEFLIQSYYNVHFRIDTLGKGAIR